MGSVYNFMTEQGATHVLLVVQSVSGNFPLTGNLEIYQILTYNEVHRKPRYLPSIGCTGSPDKCNSFTLFTDSAEGSDLDLMYCLYALSATRFSEIY